MNFNYIWLALILGFTFILGSDMYFKYRLKQQSNFVECMLTIKDKDICNK